jgi:DNA-binding transcriptional regulator YhcF (GntR family)
MDAPAAIALVRSTSLSTLVEGEVLRMILTGELDAGQQIKEVAVAERLGVGRSSVREALRALEAAGLVRIEKNVGCVAHEAPFRLGKGIAARKGLLSLRRMLPVHRANAQAGLHTTLTEQLGRANLIFIEAHAYEGTLRDCAGY